MKTNASGYDNRAQESILYSDTDMSYKEKYARRCGVLRKVVSFWISTKFMIAMLMKVIVLTLDDGANEEIITLFERNVWTLFHTLP